MSKRKTTSSASDVNPGDVVRLVYEIAIEAIDDLDTVISSEAPDILVISGIVKKGPLKGHAVRFAIAGADVLNIVSRRDRQAAIRDYIRQRVHSFADWSTRILSTLARTFVHKKKR